MAQDTSIFDGAKASGALAPRGLIKGRSQMLAIRGAQKRPALDLDPKEAGKPAEGVAGGMFDKALGKMREMHANAPAGEDPAIDPETGKPFTQKGLAAREEKQAKHAEEVAKANAADKKIADKDKPLWSKWHEARARYEVEHGEPPPANWVSSAPKNVGGDPALIPPNLREQDTFRTESAKGAGRQANGLTDDDVWRGLFRAKNAPETQWKDFPGGGQVSPDGRFRAQADNGRWVEQTPPNAAAVALDRHFEGQWAGATPDQRAALLRTDAGIPAMHEGWVTPSDTAGEVGADMTGSRQTNFNDPMTGLPVPAGARTVSGKYGSGFAAGPTLPAMPAPQPADATMPPLALPPGPTATDLKDIPGV
jgi:hypothetical protein